MSRKAIAARRVEATEAARKPQAGTIYFPRTELGRRLWRIRERILASGQPLLDW